MNAYKLNNLFRIVSGSLLAAVLSTYAVYPALAATKELTPDKLFSSLAPSIMVVLAYKEDGTVSQGSAVTIAPETLLTNCHVLAKSKSFTLRQENVIYIAKLEYVDPERDLCQITAKNFKAPPVPIGDSDNLRVGQRVYAIGNPEGLELTLSDGLISGLRKNDNGTLHHIQTSAPISHGSSGGGLFDSEGKLIGITSSGIERGQNLGFAIPINWQRELATRSKALLEKEAQNKANSTSSTSSQSVPFKERQLTIVELNQHFAMARNVRASTSRNSNITFSTTPDGSVHFLNNNGTNVEGTGIFKVNEDDNQLCININSHHFKPARGCYRLFQTGPNEFTLRSVQDSYFIKYTI